MKRKDYKETKKGENLQSKPKYTRMFVYEGRPQWMNSKAVVLGIIELSSLIIILFI